MMNARMTSQTKTAPIKIEEFREIVDKGSRPYEDRLRAHQYATLWTYAANCILGIWLISDVHLFNYKSAALAMSDTICGALIILFEFLSFSPKRFFLRWGTPVVACWLLFAPLIFWSPTPAVYLIDTLAACLLITLAILVPGMPGQGGVEKSGPDRPPGWSYNPSSWIRRWLGIALALLGFFISRYLAACQLGYVPHAWDPFFPGSTDKVLHSTVSRSFPVSDAGFGAFAYMLEVLAGFLGDRARWRTSPWVVTTFAVLVVPLGITSIVLVMLQPTVVGAWCGLCLIAAAGLLVSVPLAVHEIIAMGQFMRDALASGKSFWSVFWMGGNIVGGGEPDPDRTRYSLSQRWVESVRGVTVPFALFSQIVLGIWLMSRPDVFSFSKLTADCDHMLGALAVTIACVATAEVTRSARLLNIVVGAALVAVAFCFALHSAVVFTSELISGILLVVTSLPRGEILERYADWSKFIK